MNKRVLFVCAHRSVRSLMAESITQIAIKHYCVAQVSIV